MKLLVPAFSVVLLMLALLFWQHHQNSREQTAESPARTARPSVSIERNVETPTPLRLGERPERNHQRAQRTFNDYEKKALGEILMPFAHEDLRRMIEEGTSDHWRMIVLLGRAASERDERFRDLLHRDDLLVLLTPYEEMSPDQRSIRYALLAYRYMMTKDEDVLEELVGIEVQGEGHIFALAFIDEWDRSITAIHDVTVDGALSYTMDSFWLIREYYQPQKFAERDWTDEEEWRAIRAGN